MKQPLCLLRTLIYSIKNKHYTDGCKYQTVEYPTPNNIHILECKVCKSESVSWSWNSLEDFK